MTEKQYKIIEKSFKIVMSIPYIYAIMLIGWLVFSTVTALKMFVVISNFSAPINNSSLNELAKTTFSTLAGNWDVYRNFGYILVITILILSGFYILALKYIQNNKVVKYEDKTTTPPTDNTFLPVTNLVAGLLLLTFSYAIAKFIIEILISTNLISTFS